LDGPEALRRIHNLLCAGDCFQAQYGILDGEYVEILAGGVPRRHTGTSVYAIVQVADIQIRAGEAVRIRFRRGRRQRTASGSDFELTIRPFSGDPLLNTLAVNTNFAVVPFRSQRRGWITPMSRADEEPATVVSTEAPLARVALIVVLPAAAMIMLLTASPAASVTTEQLLAPQAVNCTPAGVLLSVTVAPFTGVMPSLSRT
jgi:hypothetical protein